MTTGQKTAGAARRCTRLAASAAVMMLGAACAIDVTDYTPFASDAGASQSTRERHADPVMTASVAPAVRADVTAQATAASVVVARGDTLYRIARRHGTSVDRLAAANAIPRPYVIKAGQRLAVPGTAQAIMPAAAPVRSGAIRQVVQAPVEGGVTVARGDTLYAIARRSRVDVADLMAANGISDPARIKTGQVLILPYQRSTASTAVSPGPGGVIARAADRPPVDDRRARADAAFSEVMTQFRVVPGQSILAPF